MEPSASRYLDESDLPEVRHRRAIRFLPVPAVRRQAVETRDLRRRAAGSPRADASRGAGSESRRDSADDPGPALATSQNPVAPAAEARVTRPGRHPAGEPAPADPTATNLAYPGSTARGPSCRGSRTGHRLDGGLAPATRPGMGG